VHLTLLTVPPPAKLPRCEEDNPHNPATPKTPEAVVISDASNPFQQNVHRDAQTGASLDSSIMASSIDKAISQEQTPTYEGMHGVHGTPQPSEEKQHDASNPFQQNVRFGAQTVTSSLDSTTVVSSIEKAIPREQTPAYEGMPRVHGPPQLGEERQCDASNPFQQNVHFGTQAITSSLDSTTVVSSIEKATPREQTPTYEGMTRVHGLHQPNEEEQRRKLTCQSSHRQGHGPNDENNEEYILISDGDDQRSTEDNTKSGTYSLTISSTTRSPSKSSDCNKAIEGQVEENPLSQLYDREQDEDLHYDDIQITQDESAADIIER
jgi:hypothetical protein